ncbi:hypothetical protein ACGFYV_05440 [Streptomyces sp. NPDC048297]|uniref:hypothetical protein n=1 Tax=Streptomyces sp. NPDC048297 TaxID=3365531 RepID=UPI00371EB825
MLRAARTTPDSSGVRRPAVALLAAVVLALLTALTTTAPPPGTTDGRAAAADAAIAGHRQDPWPRAGDGHGGNDGYDTFGTVRATTRQNPHGEPAPQHGHPATCAPGTTTVTRPGPARHTPPTTGPTDSAGRRSSPLHGRAPPTLSGT